MAQVSGPSSSNGIPGGNEGRVRVFRKAPSWAIEIGGKG